MRYHVEVRTIFIAQSFQVGEGDINHGNDESDGYKIDRSIDRSRKVIVQDVDPNSQESEPVEEILNAQKTDDIESAPTRAAVVRDTRVRSLRKEASHL